MGENDVNASVREYLKKIGKKGGEAEVTKGFGTLTPEQRAANAKKAAQARWGTKKKAVKKRKKSGEK